MPGCGERQGCFNFNIWLVCRFVERMFKPLQVTKDVLPFRSAILGEGVVVVFWAVTDNRLN